MKLAVAVLREADIEFMLGGSMAAWARGGPEPDNDLDLMVKPDDAEPALEALADAGMRVEHPPEEWLYKTSSRLARAGDMSIPQMLMSPRSATGAGFRAFCTGRHPRYRPGRGGYSGQR